MTKKCPRVVHFNVRRDWFETNSRHQKSYSKGGKKIRGCHGLLGRVVSGEKVSLLSYSSTRNNDPIAISLDRKYRV